MLQELVAVFNGSSDETVWDAITRYDKLGAYYYLIGFASSKRFLDAKAAELNEIRHDFFKL
jgi:hypothetical protein